MADIHLLYLEDADRRVILPADEAMARRALADPRYSSYELREANTIREVESLQRRLQQQVADEAESDAMRERLSREGCDERIRSGLTNAIASAATDQFTKDFLREWLKLRDLKKRDYFRSAFEHKSYFEKLEFDKPRVLEG